MVQNVNKQLNLVQNVNKQLNLVNVNKQLNLIQNVNKQLNLVLNINKHLNFSIILTFWTKIEVLSQCARVHRLFLCDVIISVCETVYHQKNVTEVQPTCKTIMMPMCMKNENGLENCVQIPRKVIWIFAPKSLNILMFELSRLKCMKCFDALIDLNFRAKNAWNAFMKYLKCHFTVWIFAPKIFRVI